MTDATRRAVSDDLDTLRRSLKPGDLSPALARLLAACSGALSGDTSGAQ
ncbi:MAG: hypothetical protein Q4G43_03020 [Mobilicoccus sp.]|nr:hypothetical protein [Mobilicoccus sp.]